MMRRTTVDERFRRAGLKLDWVDADGRQHRVADAVALAALRSAYERGPATTPSRPGAPSRGRALEEFSVWSVLATEHGPDWRAWPLELRDPHGDAVRHVARERSDEVGFQAWLQWLFVEQLSEATGDLTAIQGPPDRRVRGRCRRLGVAGRAR
jgi:4-alpha-glucanotransferase